METSSRVRQQRAGAREPASGIGVRAFIRVFALSLVAAVVFAAATYAFLSQASMSWGNDFTDGHWVFAHPWDQVGAVICAIMAALAVLAAAVAAVAAAVVAVRSRR